MGWQWWGSGSTTEKLMCETMVSEAFNWPEAVTSRTKWPRVKWNKTTSDEGV